MDVWPKADQVMLCSYLVHDDKKFWKSREWTLMLLNYVNLMDENAVSCQYDDDSQNIDVAW